MLRKNPVRRRSIDRGGRFAIVASKYNDEFVGAMVRAAQREFKRAHVTKIQVIRVPGAFEIPVVAARLARNQNPPTRR